MSKTKYNLDMTILKWSLQNCNQTAPMSFTVSKKRHVV